MDAYGETQFTGKYGYFQNRGGMQAYSGMRGDKYRRKGATDHEMSDSNKTEVKPENVPDDKHRTTAAEPVSKRVDTVEPKVVKPVVTEG